MVAVPAFGDLRLFPADQPTPPTSVINFRPGQTRANNAVTSISADTGAVKLQCDSSSPVDVILDVTGYFQ